MHIKIDSKIGMSYFGVVFDAGGVWEKEGTRGCSHLMEHLMSKTYEDLYPKMHMLSIADNAYTSENSVWFFASGLDECVSQVSQTILDRLTKQNNLWTEEQFETEKKIVLQEYGDAFNNQAEAAYLHAMRVNYNYYGPLGFWKDIIDFEYKDSLQMARDIFRTPRKIITVGNHDVKFDGKFSDKTFKSFLIHGNYEETNVEKTPKEDQSVIGLLHKHPFNISEAPIVKLLIECLGGGLESPLYQEIREKRGLAYHVECHDEVIGDQVVLYFAAQTINKNESILQDVFLKFFSQKVEEIITKQRFEECKTSNLYMKKQCEILPHNGVAYTELGPYNPFNGIELFTYEDIIEVGNRLLSPEKFQLSVD